MVAANDLILAIDLSCIGISFNYTSDSEKDDEA